MKKQFLLLAIFTLAVLAGTNTAWGQALSPSPYTPGTPAPTPTCVGTPQQPKAGIPYIYEFEEGTTATNFRFWATKDPNFVSLVGTATTLNQADSLGMAAAKKELINYSPNYLLAAGTRDSVMITWHPDLLARTDYQGDVTAAGTLADPSPTFVVGWGSAVGCTDNIKIWEIDPQPAFTVDIKVIADATKLPLPYGTTTETQCVDEVRAAKYNATFGIDYNYGWDTLYYEVISANFVTSWLPTFYLQGLDGTIQEARIDWYNSWSAARTDATTAAAGWIEGFDIAAGSAGATPAVIQGTTPLTTNESNTVNGVSMIVRVIITNNNYETTTASTIELSVAGEDATGTIDITDNGTVCEPGADLATAATDDATSRTIDPRPELIEGTPIILPNQGTTAP